MKMKIVSKKMIKPCVETPERLRKYEISYLDDLNSPMNVAVFLFYSSKPQPGQVTQLEDSLARILPDFYILAGRYIREDHSVDCNDDGAEFILAESGDEVEAVVRKTTSLDHLKDLLPDQFYKLDEAASTPLASIQITEFRWGGVAIGVSISHRIFDVCSVGNFIAAWVAGGCNNQPLECPRVVPWKKKNQAFSCQIDAFPSQLVVRRLVFSGEAIAELRRRLGSRRVTRVRAVAAVISMALIRLDRAKYGYARPCFITQPVNIRSRTVPPLPDRSCGNLAVPSTTRLLEADQVQGIELHTLLDALDESIQNTVEECGRMFAPDADGHGIVDSFYFNIVDKFKEGGSVNMVSFSDYSKFKLYEADFGWGKPVWSSIGALPVENFTILMDRKDGEGMEAWVHLNHLDMSCFQQDNDIKCLTS